MTLLRSYYKLTALFILPLHTEKADTSYRFLPIYCVKLGVHSVFRALKAGKIIAHQKTISY
jgi:hypothetical protein